MKHLFPLTGNSQKLDGGAMFGHVPKPLWSKWLTPDDKNRINLACRALLIQEENRNILLETGIGAFFEPNMRERYGVYESEHLLLNSLKQVGLTHADIDVVILSHLHFDHAGGLLTSWEADKAPALLFPNAEFVVSKIGYERACHPHVRDKASFIPGLQEMLHDSKRLVIVNEATLPLLGDDYYFMYSNGHTPGLLHTVVKDKAFDPVIFASDLIPGTPWVHLPVTMGYDRSPELLIEEKRDMLDYAIAENARLFYTHDPAVAMSYVKKDESGKYAAAL
jgi:glyoxylase-like metal-dependent hydrolase (beta-lactamase superfamily II)